MGLVGCIHRWCLPNIGARRKDTQRVAWTVGENKTNVFEAGIYNLTQPETPVLVHFGKERTEQWLLVRLKQPAPSGQPAP